MKTKVLFLFALLACVLSASAQKVKTVEGEYAFIVPSTITPAEAKLTAVERAKTEALAKEFGTIVSQTNSTMMSTENERTKSSFFSLGDSEVRGEWLKTIDQKVEQQIVDDQLVIKAWVKGEAREVTFAKVEFETRLLRNGKEDKFESEEFRDGDEFYISFCSPANGYLAIYLLDAERNANRIVPEDPKSGKEEDGCYSVDHSQRYVFIDDSEKHLILKLDQEQEINQLYIVFSPNKFYTPVDKRLLDNSDLEKYRDQVFKESYHLPYIPFKDFQKWLVKLRKKDPEVQVVTKFIKIKK